MANLKGQQGGTGQKARNGGIGGSTNNAGNHMDILKKFRYNFHYWLRNCYQGTDEQKEKEAAQKNAEQAAQVQSPTGARQAAGRADTNAAGTAEGQGAGAGATAPLPGNLRSDKYMVLQMGQTNDER